MISVLILTRNEELDLPGCLASVAWSDDVHVFDSCSTDHTEQIARAARVHFSQREFDDYARQRNAALDGCAFKHGWIFILDADERPTPALVKEMQERAANAAAEVAGFRVRRRDFLFGRWLKHSQMSPWYVRLVRRGRAHYRREVNEVLEVDGKIAQLKAPLDHFPFSKGMDHWTEKHNRYSTLEAKLIAANATAGEGSLRTALFEKDFHRRRVAQKALFCRMPLRPAIKWCYLMFVRGAFLDGRAGWTYASLQAWYEQQIVMKTRELRRKGGCPRCS